MYRRRANSTWRSKSPTEPLTHKAAHQQNQNNAQDNPLIIPEQQPGLVPESGFLNNSGLIRSLVVKKHTKKQNWIPRIPIRPIAG